LAHVLQVDTTILGCTQEEAEEKPFIASMGIYVFKRTALIEMLENNPSHMDFGGEVIPEAQKAGAALPASSAAPCAPHSRPHAS
jgi:glucose-1-phosphate adenylyltransferase